MHYQSKEVAWSRTARRDFKSGALSVSILAVTGYLSDLEQVNSLLWTLEEFTCLPGLVRADHFKCLLYWGWVEQVMGIGVQMRLRQDLCSLALTTSLLGQCLRSGLVLQILVWQVWELLRGQLVILKLTKCDKIARPRIFRKFSQGCISSLFS